MLVFRMSLPYSRYGRVRSYARNVLSTCVSAAATPGAPLTPREDEAQTQSDPPELPHLAEVTQTDDSSASVEKLNESPGAAFGEIAGTSLANGDTYACAECSIKMKGIFYVCLTCAGTNSMRLMRHKS
jgi:hypothetical protein